MRTLSLVIIFFICLHAKADSLTISQVGVTMHGVDVGKDQADQMPNKLNQSGKFVWHPELNFTFERRNFVLNVTTLVDCYGSSATYVGAGRIWKFGNHSVSTVAGLYVRNEPRDDLVFEPPKIGTTQVIPLPWVGYGYLIPLNRVDLSFQVNTNYLLSHAIIGFRIPLD